MCAAAAGPLSNDTIAYTYDELGRVIQRTINGTANQVDWTFDALGRVTSEENLLGEFEYAYDGVTNRLATVTYPNGQASTHSYLDDEQDHRLQTIHHKYPNTSTLSRFDYTYNAVGNILTWRQQADSTAVIWKYGYDSADQLIAAVKHATDAQETVLKRYSYAYDPARNRTVEQIDNGVTLSAYDSLNRLTTQAPGGPMVVAGLLNEPGTVTINGVPAPVDANSNFRGTVPTTTGTNSFTIVAKDASGNTTTQQYEVDVAGTGKTFTYDANGNLTSDGTRTFEWDARNQMISVTQALDRAEYSYDFSRRLVRIVTKQDATVVTDRQLVWCDDRVCEERSSAGGVLRREFPFGSQIGGAAHFVFTDHLGSIESVMDAVDTVVARYSYDPFGRRTLTYGGTVTDLGFAGLRWDESVERWLAKYRQYDASLGRWLSRAPIELLGGINVYRYGSRNPLGEVDTSGLASCQIKNVTMIMGFPPRALRRLSPLPASTMSSRSARAWVSRWR